MSNRRWISWVFQALFLGLAGSPTFASDCPGWTNEFASPGVNDWVRASVVFDDGTGPALYVAGLFVDAGGRPANHVARWNGSTWSALGQSPIGGGVDGQVRALAVFDDGHGAALYAAGYFASAGGMHAANIAKWDGATWRAVGGGLGGLVDSLGVFDDGHGSALYAGGEFVTAGGAPAKNIAKWDGLHWSALGSGLTPAFGVASVYSMTAFDDGSGEALYVGGAFLGVNGMPAKYIARWNGSNWSTVGSGSRGFCSALAVFDDGHGPALYAGGGFGSDSEQAFHSFAKWTGSTWQPLGPTGDHVFAQSFGVHDDGSGAALYVGFQRNVYSEAAEFRGIGKWDGSHWTTIANDLIDPPSTFVSFDDGSGEALYAGGRFTLLGQAVASRIARWRGGAWAVVGTSSGVGGLDGPVFALQVFDDGSGPALIAGGNFLNAGGVHANHVAKWNGTLWRNLGQGTSSTVKALAVFDDGTGPALFAGGDFWNGVGVHSVVKWNGSTWTSLDDGSLSGDVHVLTVFDDGHGPALYAGGSFVLIHHGHYSSDTLAKWNGATWIGIGGQLDGGSVDAVGSFDDGHGPALYVGGDFYAWGEHGIAKWDGVRLSSVDHGYSFTGMVKAFTVFDDGNGPALYAGGQINAGGNRLNGIARWNGTHWSSLQSGLQGTVHSLIGFDDESGHALFAGCAIWGGENYFGFDSHSLARWDASGWSVVGNGFSAHQVNSISASAVFDAGDGPALFVAGDFTMAGDTPTSYIARRCVH